MTSTSTDRRLGMSGGVAFKAPAQLATTANITLSGEQTIDGVLTASSRVLVKDQDTATENGVYTSDSGSWERTPDFDGALDVVQGSLIYITQGAISGGSVYKLDTVNPITIGSSELAFSVMDLPSLPLPIASGGTGGTTLEEAQTNLGILPPTDVLVNGECILQYASSTSLNLAPRNGRGLIINEAQYSVVEQAVYLGSTALAINTTFKIYAEVVAGENPVGLIASTIAHAISAADGTEIMSGDATRAFVGLARTSSASQWVDTSTARFVRSWFNDSGIAGQNQLASDTTIGTTGYAQLSSAFKCEMLAFDNEIASVMFGAMVYSSTTGSLGALVSIGGSTSSSNVGAAQSITEITAANDARQIFAGGAFPLSEGYNYFVPLAIGPSTAGATMKQYSGLYYNTVRRG